MQRFLLSCFYCVKSAVSENNGYVFWLFPVNDERWPVDLSLPESYQWIRTFSIYTRRVDALYQYELEYVHCTRLAADMIDPTYQQIISTFSTPFDWSKFSADAIQILLTINLLSVCVLITCNWLENGLTYWHEIWWEAWTHECVQWFEFDFIFQRCLASKMALTHKVF